MITSSLSTSKQHRTNEKSYDNNREHRQCALNNHQTLTMSNECRTMIDRLNEHTYWIALDSSMKTNNQTNKSLLDNIHTDFIHCQEYLLAHQGSIRMKEYALDGYSCRCNDHNRLYNVENMNNNEHILNYQLKF
jgi:hypothetical protein